MSTHTINQITISRKFLTNFLTQSFAIHIACHPQCASTYCTPHTVCSIHNVETHCYVLIEVSISRKSVLTKFTFEFLFFIMCALVFNQLSIPRKSFLTKLTFWWLLLRMHTLMFNQVSLSTKSFVTKVTFICFFF